MPIPTLSRRLFLKLLALWGSSFTSSCAAQSTHKAAEYTEYSDEEIKAILLDELEPGSRSSDAKLVIEPFLFENETLQDQFALPWAQDSEAHDYLGLPEPIKVGSEFELTDSVLQNLFLHNSFQYRSESNQILFGLRGCEIGSSEKYLLDRTSASLRTARPDFSTLKCVLGVWDTRSKTVSVFRGSTVPNNNLMRRYVLDKADKCNLFPTGLHPMKVGTHYGKKLKQYGVFRQTAPLFVRRSPNRLTYSLSTTIWDDGDGVLANDNIHAALFDYRKKPPFFSSAGCQTIAGGYSNDSPYGAWRVFRQKAGLDINAKRIVGEEYTVDSGKQFDYLLLTGDDAFSAAGGQAHQSLRFGSTGNHVKALQEMLGLAGDSVDGQFGRQTMELLLNYQNTKLSDVTGIWRES